MSVFAVGDDGLILRLAGATLRHENEGGCNLNGVARTHVAGENFERVIAVGDVPAGDAALSEGADSWFRLQQVELRADAYRPSSECDRICARNPNRICSWR